MKIRIKKVRDDAILPEYQTSGAAGFDFHACISEIAILKVGQTMACGTGVSVEIPEGYELQVRSRSGLAFKHKITMFNGVGTIDADFRGEIKVMLVNHGDEDFRVEPGMRIAQGVVNKIEKVEWVESEELSETDRADGGYGSTGI